MFYEGSLLMMFYIAKKELINRWQTPKGKILLEAILKAFKKKINLDLVPNLQLIEGKWDLRGAVLSVVESERTIGNDEHSLNQKFGALKVKCSKLLNIDFSYADVSYSFFQECYFENCLFNETKAKEIRVYASDFESCQFIKSNFSYSFMNRNVGSNAGSFKNCRFLNTNLKEVIFSFPIMDNCIFEHCNLYATNFDGSRMRNVKFSGTIDSAWFRGYSTTAQKSILWLSNKVEPKKYSNNMNNVDFSDAKLVGVTFTNAIDISNCLFPLSEDYILINNLSYVMECTKAFFRKNWVENDQKKGIELIEEVYYKPDKYSQKLDFIDTFPIPSSDIEFEKRFFEVIRYCNAKNKEV